MKTATVEIKDEVNVRLRGVDQETLGRCRDALTYFVPGYRNMPSFKIGHWDGKIRLLAATGRTYLNLIDDISHILGECNYDVVFDDTRRDVSSVIDAIQYPQDTLFQEYKWPDGSPVILRDYQLSAVYAAIRAGSGVLELATGAGKSLCCAVLAKIYAEFGNVVVIVPTINLVLQTQSTFKRVGLSTGVWFGEIKDRQRITISTWQSLEHVPELFEGTDCLILDEAHQITGKTLQEILTGPGANVPFRFGCTGTVPKDPLFRQQLKATIGPTIFTLKSWELQEAGVLAQSQIFQVVLNDRENPKYHGQFEEWIEQVNWMFQDQKRLEYIAEFIRSTAEDGNTLVLVQYKNHGKVLEEMIPGSISLDGRDRAKYRKEVFEKFDKGTNGILICTNGIAAVGIDIPNIHNLIIIEPGKKFEKIIQIIGRGLRKSETKDAMVMFDLCGNDGFSKAHARQRRKLFEEAKHDCQVLEVSYNDANS